MPSLITRLTQRSRYEISFAQSCRISVLVLMLLPVSSVLQAQSSDNGDSANPGLDPVVDELEKNLESERKELENVLQERETMLAEQAGVRDQLAEQQKQLEEKMEALLELCEQHNAANSSDPIDCEKEVSSN